MKKVKLPLSALTPTQIADLCAKVGPACTANPQLPGLDEKAGNVTGAGIDLRTKQTDVDTAEAAWKGAIDARDLSEADAVTALEILANGAEGAASGSDAALETSLFELTGERQPPQPLGMVENLGLTSNRFTGQLDSQWDRLLRAASFELQWTLTPQDAASWKPLTSSTRSKITLTGLTSGQDVWVRVRGIGGSTGFGPWSQPAHRMVP